ncbi:MAG: endonuclease/exonuclease/phosphatase family protein [Betaproteobacteria bacterium]|nr:endonuclease/exonuclease/phosphatase family protein [Betaproteobacteria bacterium]
MHRTLHVATYNIHKGFSQFSRRMTVHELREELRGLHADVVFLQEVLGTHAGHAERYENWPETPQYEFLADAIWSDFAYGRNAVYEEGHHGNAILSRYPIERWENEDVSAHRFESRGLLHCEIAVNGWDEPLHCVNVHLGLFARDRRKQLLALKERMLRLVPPHHPLIVAGDFNDWRIEAGEILASALQMEEAFELAHGRPARSFPSALPLLQLDRIYVRGFKIKSAEVLHGRPWSKLSDHAVLSATVIRL